MIKHNQHFKAVQGNGDILHRIVLRTEECDIYGEKAKILKNGILRNVAENPDLLGYGFMDYYSLKFEYINGAWQLTAYILENKQ
jgi:hypothetical protein